MKNCFVALTCRLAAALIAVLCACAHSSFGQSISDTSTVNAAVPRFKLNTGNFGLAPVVVVHLNGNNAHSLLNLKGAGAKAMQQLTANGQAKPAFTPPTVSGEASKLTGIPANSTLSIQNLKLPPDTLPKLSAAANALKSTVKKDLTVPDPLANSPVNPANIAAVPGQMLTGAGGIPGTSKQQLQKTAALRSQLISESISKNFTSLKRPSSSSNLTLENDFLYQPVLGTVAGRKYVDVIGLSGSVMAFGIPLNINISNSQTAFGAASPVSNSLFKFGFSPASLAGLLKSDLQQYDDLKNSAFHGFTFTGYLQQTIREKTQSLESGTTSERNSVFAPYLNDSEKLKQLMTMPEKQLRAELTAAVLNKYLADMKKPGADSVVLQKQRQLDYQKADSIATVVTAVNSGMKKSGISPAKMLLAENFLSGKTSASFNASEAANALFTKKPGSGLPGMLGGLSDLKIGAFGNNIPGGTSGDDAQLMKGASIGVRLGYYPVTFGYGSLNDISSAKDDQFANSVYTSPKNITFLGAEMKRGVFGDVKVAVVSSYNGQSNNVQYAAPTLPGNAVAFTVTKALKIDKVGNFTFDVSKSGTLYSSSYQPGSEAILEKKAGANLTANLFQAVSAGFTHNLDIPSLHASDDVYFDYAGLGYQNPANSGYSGATMKFGGNLRKSFYQNKLQLSFRTDYRSMPLSYTTSDKWKNYQVQLDSKYKVNSRFNLDLKYIEAATSRNISGSSVSVYDSKKLEISGNNTFKVGKYLTTTHLSISTQALTNTYESATGSNLVNFNYVQSLVLKNSSLTATVFYNKEMSSYVLIGDMLTTDLTYQYTLFKGVQMASGVTYLNNATIAKQAGVKQGLQFTAGKHFDINASVDLRKNLITPQYADLYASCRGELAIKYYFKID